MFYFGDDPSLVVDFYLKKVRGLGPKTPDIPWSEMGEEDIINTYIRTRLAYRRAENEGADESVLEALRDSIETAFTHGVAKSAKLAEVPYKKAFWAIGLTIDEYQGIASSVRHPSSADAS